MSSKDNLENAKIGVAIVGELISAAGNDPNVKEAAGNLGKAALTISRTINNALLPLAAVNYAFDRAKKYFDEKFEGDLRRHADKIPEESIVEPKPSIAGPTLQGLAFAHEEPSLREMFLGLLSTAMDGRNSDIAHPAFVEIIKQLDSKEAIYLNELLTSQGISPLIKIKRNDPSGGSVELESHILNMRDKTSHAQTEEPRISAMLDNWARLGLIEIHYDGWLTAAESYSWAETRPEYVRQVKAHSSDLVAFDKGYIKVSSLGKQFAKSIGLKSGGG